MIVQIVMNQRGDSRYEFDADSSVALAQAEQQFRTLTGKGFAAIALGRDGEPGTRLKEFDPAAQETIFIPQLQGG